MTHSPCHLSVLAIALGGILSATAAWGQTDAFTYQGRLERNGTPFTGTANLQLKVMDALTAGTALATTAGTYTIVNGQFTVTFTAVPASVFNGNPRWVEIGVDDPDVAGISYVPMTPRQPVTATPYAMRANTAATATTITGNLPTSQLTGTINPSILNTGTTTGTMTFSPASGAPFAVGSTTKVVSLNADLLDGLDSNVFLQKSGGTMTGNLSIAPPAALDFGSTTRQMLSLFGSSFGIGVQTGTLYQRTNSDFSWFKGGVHSDLQNTPGAGGVETMRLGSNGTLSVVGSQAGFITTNRADVSKFWQVYADGATTSDSLRIWSTVTGDRVTVKQNGDMAVVGEITAPAATITSTGSSTAINALYNGSANGIGVYAYSASTTGFPIFGQSVNGGYGSKFVANGASGWAVYGVSDTGFAGRFEGKVSITGATTIGSTLDVANPVTSTGGQAGFVAKNRNDQSKQWVTYARNGGGIDQLAFYSSTAGFDVASLSPNGDMYLVGALSTTVLTIRGGADVAEPFPMSKTNASEDLEPGSVVVIDAEHPGKLKLSTEAYDTRVAGIISGAGGVKPGLRLHQEGVMEGDEHVALSGRVYVKANADHGPIRPGDLLTTSEKPGHASKVMDHAKSQGAILGKAMSSLDEGTGLVLVLVTLQ